MKKRLILTGLCLVFILSFVLPAVGHPAGLEIKSDKLDTKLSLFTQEEQEWIKAQQNTIFYVGVAQDYIPIEYLDENGRPRGMGIELLRKVHQLTGLTFKLYPNSKNETWEEILQSTVAHRIDVLSTVSFTQDRQEHLEFSVPYMETTQVIVGDKNETQLFGDVAQIKGNSTFAVPRGYWFLDIIKREVPQAGIIEVDNMEEALRYVIEKKADYTVCEIPVFTYYKEQGLYKDIKIVGELKEKNQIFIGVRKDCRQLIPIINKVIQHINYDEIYETSMVIPKDDRGEKRLIALAGLLGFLLLVAVYYLCRTFNQLVRSKRAAEQASRDKTQLMANISHDLRTPLTVVLGYAQALAEGQVKKEDDKERYIRKISERIKYLSAIVDDFFLLARLEDSNLTLNREQVRIDYLLQQIVEDAELRAKAKQIAVSLTVAEGAAVYKRVDAVKLYRAVENIMANALAYTENGGRIEVSAVPAGQGKVEIAIKDNGTGIDPADIPHIFDRYYKGRQARKESIGLGLYIAREILHKHQGEIRVESELGQGSSFYLRF
jgi:signal transduction histidine kinase